MTRNVKKEMKGHSSKCYFPEKRTLGLVASILAVENVVAPEGEILRRGILDEQPVVHGDTEVAL